MATSSKGTASVVESQRVAVDIGGTFTDVTIIDSATGRISVAKALTTPDDLSQGVIDALERANAALPHTQDVIHGTTIAINTLIERSGAKTALITSRGMRDVYEIGRVNRPDAFNLHFRKHKPLIPRDYIIEANERIAADGAVVASLDEEEQARLLAELAELDPQSVAIVFLHSYAHPEHEDVVKKLLASARPDLFVTASHELTREYREYERTSTTAANAYVGPRVQGYLERLSGRLQAAGFRHEMQLMQSSGGTFDLAAAAENPIQLVESGPAGGIAGSASLCKLLGITRAIAFDMGGTTAKACVVENYAANLASDYFIDGYNEGLAVRVPTVDIKEIGTGGGSFAWVDNAGGLHVGPESAGASPGPACYGRGGVRPTITDAHSLLGHLPTGPDGPAGQLDLDAARKAMKEEIADKLGITVDDSAKGILAIANAAMANAIRAITVERGLDPRDFTLIAYGGGGPLHAVDIAQDLGISKVIIPQMASVFSSAGMLRADTRRDFALTRFTDLAGCTWDELTTSFEENEEQGWRWCRSQGIEADRVRMVRAVDMRYAGQEHAVTVTISGDGNDVADMAAIKTKLNESHLRLFGHNAPEESVQLVTFRSSLIVASEAGAEAWGAWLPTLSEDSEPSYRSVLFAEGETIQTPILKWASLPAGTRANGPLIVDGPGSSTVIGPNGVLEVGPSGELMISLGA